MSSEKGLSRWLSTIAVVCMLFRRSTAAFDLAMGDDLDLENFVTRPELKAPKFKVSKYVPKEIDAGYWFVGPYADIVQREHAASYYQACQTGPHIYDGDGNLVWSGACQFRNQNTCDFRAYETSNGSSYLSAIINYNPHANDPVGRGSIMNNSFSFKKSVDPPATSQFFNMHEFKLIDDGTKALLITITEERASLQGLDTQHRAGWIHNAGFNEVDLATDEVLFEWRAWPQVSLSESSLDLPEHVDESSWNWFHPNSVDKSADGDYLFSGRYVNAIYKISGKDGSILWRLGGVRSDFRLEGFNFSRQHDAQWITSNDDFEDISFLDNGGDEKNQTSSYTSGLYVRLDKRTKVATVIQRWVRPGERFSAARGNFQRLPSGHVFGGWSDNSHISEHSADGRLLMEAEFSSRRFVTYRAYKSNFTGNPQEPPVMKAIAYGLDEESAVTVYYASWNGATEVAMWKFYRKGDSDDDATLLGSIARSGFETRFQTRGFVDREVFVEAIDKHGNVIGRSKPDQIHSNIDWNPETLQAKYVEAQVVDEPLEKTEL